MNQQYAIVTATNVAELEKQVTARLSKGWELAGSLVYVAESGQFIQPLVYKPKE